MKKALVLCVSALLSVNAMASDQALICSGNEPSWTLRVNKDGSVLFGDAVATGESGPSRPEKIKVLSRQGFIGFTSDRGTVIQGESSRYGKVTIALTRDENCSDGMSEEGSTHQALFLTSGGTNFYGCCKGDLE